MLTRSLFITYPLRPSSLPRVGEVLPRKSTHSPSAIRFIERRGLRNVADDINYRDWSAPRADSSRAVTDAIILMLSTSKASIATMTVLFPSAATQGVLSIANRSACRTGTLKLTVLQLSVFAARMYIDSDHSAKRLGHTA